MSSTLPLTQASVIVVLGPARSGKSEWAETLAHQRGKPVVYIATAQRDDSDPEWQARIQQHQRRRPPSWRTQEEPIALGRAIQTASLEVCLLVDSLGTWVANCLDSDDNQWREQEQEFLKNVKTAPCDLILVAEEVGWGVIPAYPLGRQFRDRLGVLVRRVGSLAEAVYLVTGGYAVNLTTIGVPLSLP